MRWDFGIRFSGLSIFNCFFIGKFLSGLQKNNEINLKISAMYSSSGATFLLNEDSGFKYCYSVIRFIIPGRVSLKITEKLFLR